MKQIPTLMKSINNYSDRKILSMSVKTKLTWLSVSLATLFSITACGDHDHDHGAKTPASEAAHGAVVSTNRLPVGEQVRRNLGITFAKAEYRAVAATVRLPGKFVTPLEAVRHYHGPLRGRVEAKVSLFQQVPAGTILYELDSPAWREHQSLLAERAAAVTRAAAAVSVALAERAQAERMLVTLKQTIPYHQQRTETLEASISLWNERVTALEAIQLAGGGRATDLAEARGRLVDARAERASVAEHQAEHGLEHARVDAALNRQGDAPARLSAELEAARAEKDAAESAYAVALQSAAALSGMTVEELMDFVDVPLGQALTPDSGKVPRWRVLDRLVIRAERAGIISELNVAAGSWIDESTEVLTLIDPTQVRFDGAILQHDLARVRVGQTVMINAPAPAAPEQRVMGKLVLGPIADAHSRTVPISVVPTTLAAWIRPGVSTVADITVAGGEEELAIPLAAVTQDEIKKILYRRDPSNPDQVIRLDADLGVSDGRWVVINSGLKEGDEVVLDGIYELMLSGSGQAKGGHFHADGTFHEAHD
jgi:HlyD family secretion protein